LGLRASGSELGFIHKTRPVEAEIIRVCGHKSWSFYSLSVVNVMLFFRCVSDLVCMVNHELPFDVYEILNMCKIYLFVTKKKIPLDLGAVYAEFLYSPESILRGTA
jgi:hypothetical protein